MKQKNKTRLARAAMTLLFALFTTFGAWAETVTFDFEDGVIPSNWTNDATYPWEVTGTSQGDGHHGVYCIKSGNSGVNSSESSIEATFTFVGDGSISFLGGCWGEGTSTAWDKCIFYIDDVQQFAYGALQTWDTYRFEVEAGEHKFKWSFTKDSSVNGTGDAFFIDDVVVDLGSASACSKPTGLSVELTPGNGTVATLSWTENGSATAWQICLNDDETNLIDATSNPYTLENLTPEQTYTAKVRACCDAENQSSWSSVVTFKPTNAYSITVNDGTTTNEYVPFYGYYADSGTKGQFIIPASTLQDIAYGTINKLTFYVNNSTSNTTFTNSSGTSSKFEVYMGEVDNTTFDGTTFNDWTSLEKVMNAATLEVKDHMLVVTLDAPYQYMGGNLLIGFNETTNGGYAHTYWYGVEATGASLGGYATSFSQKNFLPKTTFDYTPGVAPSCFKPTNLAAGTPDAHSVELSWIENGEATQWQICVNGDEDNLVDADSNPFILTGLTPETEYTVKVRANCGGGDVSDWSNAVTFTTDVACPVPTNVAVSDVEPFAATVSWEGLADNYNLRYRAARGFNYGFETTEAWTITDFDPCTTYDGDGLPSYGISGYDLPNANYVGSVIAFSDNDEWAAHSGNAMGAFMDAIPDTDAGITANDDYFITPELTIASGDHFTFWARSVTANYGLERMKVGIYGGNGTISTYLAGSATEYVEVPVDWTKYDYDLSAYNGQAIQLAINCVSADAFALLFDDIFVGNPNDDTWDVTLNNVTSPYTLNGLTDETMYEVQVQAACGGEDGVSEWVGASFTTPSNCATPTELAANNITSSGATLSWTGYQDSYNVQYRTAASRKTYYFNDFNDRDATGWTYGGTFIYGYSDPIYGYSGDENHFLQMGWGSTDEETIISCELPAYESGAHVEFYYFGYNTANTFQVGFSTTTNDAEAFTWSDPIDAPLSEYTLYNEELADGVKYVAFKATASSQSASIFIDDFGIFGSTIPAGEWNTATANEATLALTSLNPETKYEWQVQGINPSCDGGVTAWSEMSSFTTVGVKPTDLAVSDITSSSATISWTGYCESYEVYVSPDEPDNLLNADFEDQAIPADFINDETYPWTVVEGNNGYYIQSSNAGVASSTSSISITKTYAKDGTIEFDAQLRGEGTSTAWDKCIFSIDGVQQWAYGAIGEEWYHLGSYVTAGVHTFTWSYTKDNSEDAEGDYFAVDNIVMNETNIKWATTPIVVNETECPLTELTPNTTYYVQVVGVIGENNYESGIMSFTTLGKADILFAAEGYATYYNSMRDVVLPAGMQAHVVIGGSTTLEYEKIAEGNTEDYIIPAGTAVLLQVETAGAKQTLSVDLATPSVASYTGTNLLHGSDVEKLTFGGDKYYKLTYSNNNDNFGWYWGADNGEAFSSPAHKAWLALGSSGAPFLGLPGWEDTTGIVPVGVNPEDGEWYTLQGMKVGKKPTTKGVYIHNGRKVLIP